MDSYLYIAPDLGQIGTLNDARLAETTERHRIELTVPPLTVCLRPLEELARRPAVAGVVIAMERGWPGASHLRFASRVLRTRRRVWLHWPREEAVECVDRERLRSHWNHWAVITAFRAARRVKGLFRPQEADPGPELVDRCATSLRQLLDGARPVPVDPAAIPDRSRAVPAEARGAYLRTDYWVNISSGGSYGHTCYVAKELAARTREFVCFMAQRYALLDEFGVRQVVMPAASESASELSLLSATWHYYPMLKVAFDAMRPAFIYERLVLGNFAGALVSHELQIPYIVEYNGSEISMSRSFDGGGYQHEDLFIGAEDAAFRQATMITVVSRAIKDSLVSRGVDPRKILVNPNGADPAVYAPPAADARRAIRESLGFGDDDRVVGFSGTFGGWHGIDVLAAALPAICARSPRARFLLIGDGSHKRLLDEAIQTHQLESRVRSVGRVPQAEGARLLGACDLFVSPHNSHMVDSRFFGSPTKLFEYMAMGRGVVASELEQLGEVLSPALRSDALTRIDLVVGAERAVLCAPGDVDDFTEGVVGLVARPEVADALGRNARQAVLDSYTWQRHVENVWHFAATGAPAVGFGEAARRERQRVETGDRYKDEVQNQWDNNPVGPAYAKVTRPHTLEWFREIETHRYSEYAPWMHEDMEFGRHAGEELLEIGAGVGTDLSQFAARGALVTDVDLSAGHLELARENFSLRGLPGSFVHHDAEDLPFPDNRFDVVYSNGVLHHTPNTHLVVREIHRVLKPGGLAIVMMYAENSLHYWYNLVWGLGLRRNLLRKYSMGEIMSRHVELTQNNARPLVKVYTGPRLATLFAGFAHIELLKRQLTASELPNKLKWIPLPMAGRLMGWSLIIKARKAR